MPGIKSKIISLLLLFAMSTGFAQKNPVDKYGDLQFYKGLEQYERERYGAAKKTFDNYLRSSEPRSELSAEASFYRAMCSVELRNSDSEFQVRTFISSYPSNPKVHEAAFRLADYYYDRKGWAKSVSWYNQVDRYKLGKQKLPEYYFKKGYCFYMRKDYEQARANFYEILDAESSFTGPATYYYSHIHYEDGNLETALMGFRNIEDDPLFSAIAPWYIAQIFYMKGEYREVIAYAPPLMDSVSEKRLGEMSKIIGESHFMLKEYQEAIPYLEIYQTHAKNFSIHDHYQLAYAYYQSQEYAAALPLFEKISYRNTEIAQSALYHLGDCYLKTNQLGKAMVSFSKASQMEFDPLIQQDALFNYCKASFEMQYTPFNETIRALELYIRSYPAADNVDEAYNLLVQAYMGTRNYSMALESISRIRRRSEQIDRAHQKVAFYRGLELYKNLRFQEAEDVLDVSLKYAQYDPVIAARTYFWLAESSYRTGDLKTADLYYREFQKSEMSVSTEEYALSNYSRGYLDFDREHWDAAIGWFSKYINLLSGRKTNAVADAHNRIADCYFMKSSYQQAITWYDKNIALASGDADYALFQKGFTLGLLDRTKDKIQVLDRLSRNHPESNYVDDALFETGRSYVVLNQPAKAMEYYRELIEKHPASSYTVNAMNQLGLIYYNQGDYEEALEYYEQVARTYPGTPEAENALGSMKNIYVRRDRVNDYLAFLESMGRDISTLEQDSLSYTAAELIYMGGDCDGTVRAFRDYLDAFPNGRYLLSAHFYKADCQLKLKQDEDALESLDYIIGQPRNMFSEPALDAASKIAWRQKDYNRAAAYYLNLVEVAENRESMNDAQVGLMRCYFELSEHSKTIEAAREVLAMERLQEEYAREANYKIASSFMGLNEVDFAYGFYEKVAVEVNTAEGAESKYRLIEIGFGRGEIDPTEELIYELIELNTPHQYWMGKAFLVLSDVYEEKGDSFSAINTLQSLIDYYTIPDDGIIAEARQRKAALTEIEEEEIAEENTEF